MFPYEGGLKLLQATAQPAYRCSSRLSPTLQASPVALILLCAVFQPRGAVISAGVRQVEGHGGHPAGADVWSHGGETDSWFRVIPEFPPIKI